MSSELLAPAKSIAQMRQVIVNDWIDAALCALLMAVVLAMVGYGIAAIRRARASAVSISHESPPVYADVGTAHAV